MKDIFDKKRIEWIGKTLASLSTDFDKKAFLQTALKELEALSVMQRVGQIAQAIHTGFPVDYERTLQVLYAFAPMIDRAFVTLILPEYVARYGKQHFDTSMQALRYFTPFGSSEFAIRHFLRDDFARTLAVMQSWSQDPDEHVRRLSSEGSRPRLPWSFKLERLIADPNPVGELLERLNRDPALYVRKSVANHLNDITRDHPDWVMSKLEHWPLENAHTTWIARHALRTLIKQGDNRALHLMGAGAVPLVTVSHVTAQPSAVTLGNAMALSLTITSTAAVVQKLVIDYTVHYVKKNGKTTPKVFKFRTVTLAPTESRTLTLSQVIKDYTTRTHYAGRHEIDISANGVKIAKTFFDIVP